MKSGNFEKKEYKPLHNLYMTENWMHICMLELDFLKWIEMLTSNLTKLHMFVSLP